MPKIIEAVPGKILDTVRARVAAEGWEALNIRSIAANCGIALGTVYNYFPSREAILAAVIGRDWKAAENRIRTCFASGGAAIDREAGKVEGDAAGGASGEAAVHFVNDNVANVDMAADSSGDAAPVREALPAGKSTASENNYTAAKCRAIGNLRFLFRTLSDFMSVYRNVWEESPRHLKSEAWERGEREKVSFRERMEELVRIGLADARPADGIEVGFLVSFIARAVIAWSGDPGSDFRRIEPVLAALIR